MTFYSLARLFAHPNRYIVVSCYTIGYRERRYSTLSVLYLTHQSEEPQRIAHVFSLPLSFFQSLSHNKHDTIIDKHGAMSSPTNIPPYYKCNSCGHHFGNNRSFCNHFTYSKTCIRVKPQQSLVHLHASSVLPGNELLIERGSLSFLNDPSFVDSVAGFQ